MQVPRTTLAAVFLVGVFATQATASPNRLSTAASGLAGKPVSVEHAPIATVDAYADLPLSRIVVRPRFWKTLNAIPAYNYATTPWAVAIFAHEVGHIVRGVSENDAACWATDNMYRVARVLGFGPHKAKVVAKWARQDQRAYCQR